MMKQIEYLDWDFDDVWAIDEDTSTPYLLDMDKPNSVDVGLRDQTPPETAIVVPSDIQTRRLSFDVTTFDTESGVHTAKLYVDNIFSSSINSDIIKSFDFKWHSHIAFFVPFSYFTNEQLFSHKE